MIAWVAAAGASVLVLSAAGCSDDGSSARDTTTTTTPAHASYTTAQSAEFSHAPGTESRVCVDVDRLIVSGQLPAGTTSIRSGDFVAGNVTDLKSTETLTKKIYWLPRDPAIAKTAKLTVVVADPTAPDKPVVTQRSGDGIGRGWVPSDGSTVSGGTLPPGSKVQYFWPSGIRFPGHGRWRLSATAPAHWGCFIVTV